MTDKTPESAAVPKADPSMFSDCGDTPCPQPVMADPKNEAAALAEGVRMRNNPAEWAFVRLSKLIEEFEAKLDIVGDAGHASSEPGIIDSLVRGTDWAAGL